VAIPKSDVRKAFGQRVRMMRKQRGYSQEGLAERADLHFTYVSSVERGERNISLINIVKLARALKVSSSSLFQDIV
jgi:transcriptional regulator with XRE-family HTH domain